ncbi:MAG: helix-turn-helix transcriptional regulator [Clostridium lundense]|nr:helix-turn-helix transcriptional regulator [Clostridium lundense]
MLYTFLRGRLRQLDMTQADLARVLGIQQSAVSQRFCGRTPWSSTEMYQVLDVCQAQPDELHLYFPRDGKAVNGGIGNPARHGKRGSKIIIPSEIRIVTDQSDSADAGYRIRIERI